MWKMTKLTEDSMHKNNLDCERDVDVEEGSTKEYKARPAEWE